MKELSGVEVLWLDGYDDGPTAGVARYKGREHYFRAVFDDKADHWTEPRRFILYELSDPQIDQAWKKHRLFEQKVSTRSCYHEGREDPVRRPEHLHHGFYDAYPPKVQEVGDPVGWFALPLEAFRTRVS